MIEFENDVRFYRELHGLNIRARQIAVDLSYSTIQRIETGDVDPMMSHALRLASFFNVPLETLFFTKENRNERIIPDHILRKRDSSQAK